MLKVGFKPNEPRSYIDPTNILNSENDKLSDSNALVIN